MLVLVAKKRCGFTLVELRVVISIIALLVSILLPALSGARRQARTLECAIRLRNIGIATESYAITHDEWLPLSHRAALLRPIISAKVYACAGLEYGPV